MGKYLDQHIKDLIFQASMESGVDQMIAIKLLDLAEAIQADLKEKGTYHNE